jgi:hypothetical protein
LLGFYVEHVARRLGFALLMGAWLSSFLGAGLERAYDTIPRLDWRVWIVAALWMSSTYILGSWRPIIRASSEPLLQGLEGS